MNETRHVKLFRIGRNQAVRIPRAFELPGDEAVVRKIGDQLIIEAPKKRMTLIEFLDTLETIDEPFPEIEDLPPEPVDL
jgi:antitoxin VapB